MHHPDLGRRPLPSHLLLAALLIALPSKLHAQAPSPGETASREAAVLARAQQEDVITAAGFSYDPKDRRDPFLSIHDIKQTSGPRPPGARGMEIGELDLQGIVLSGSERYAIVLGSDDKGYNLSEGDALFDGKVKSIEKDRVIFLRKETDPLSPFEYREVVKRLDPEQR